MPTKAYNTPQRPEDPNAPYFTIQEAAYLLKCSVKTVRRRIKNGAPHSRATPGGPIRISREDIDYQYAANRVHPAPIRRTRTSRTRATAPAKSAA